MRNEAVRSLFETNQLAIFVEVGGVHFHSLVPRNLVLQDGPLNSVSGMKRKEVYFTGEVPAT